MIFSVKLRIASIATQEQKCMEMYGKYYALYLQILSI